ncbi:YibE/F family protein, partial [Candidatus Parcubacteria bacterium]|nr:YibE/F family protein [Candidatus Parcubacteria bacterium]
IFKFILPQISAGRDPILVAIVGSLLIIPLTFYLSHGLNRKTTTAVLGTLAALLITGILAKIFTEATHLTGYASEEAAFLQVIKEGTINIKGLVLAGIIIGVLGILDDITVAQAAVVQQLKKANPQLKSSQLFTQAMGVGQDHIASMVNTLVLVYAGASLPLLLLFVDNPLPFSQVINYEIIAEEIVRTLVGSIGLIAAVPITTFLASQGPKRNPLGTRRTKRV